MTVPITVDGVTYPVPSAATDTNWAAQQVAFEQAVGTSIANLQAAAVTGPSDIQGTPASGTGITGADTEIARHAVHKITVSYVAAQAAATTKDITLWTLPAKTRVLRVVADVTTKFIGGAIAAMTLEVGRTAGGNQYVLAADVFSAAVVLGNAQGFLVDQIWTTTTPVMARWTATGANTSALTQGSVDFYIEVCTYP
jgi:hypothetical protein